MATASIVGLTRLRGAAMVLAAMLLSSLALITTPAHAIDDCTGRDADGMPTVTCDADYVVETAYELACGDSTTSECIQSVQYMWPVGQTRAWTEWTVDCTLRDIQNRYPECTGWPGCPAYPYHC